MNPLIHHWFDARSHKPVIAATQHKTAGTSGKKISLANFSFRITLIVRTEFVRFHKESQMAWKTPKIVEVSVGMEINMYACAARK